MNYQQQTVGLQKQGSSLVTVPEKRNVNLGIGGGTLNESVGSSTNPLKYQYFQGDPHYSNPMNFSSPGGAAANTLGYGGTSFTNQQQ
jgi:hypothetical protein